MTESKEPPASAILAHPLRVRILAIVNETPMSPIQFVRAELAPELHMEKEPLSPVSYHFRALEEAGCIELLEVIQRRGAAEHVYRGKAADCLAEKRDAMTPEERAATSRTIYQSLAARVEVSLLSGVFDARIERRLWWLAREVDPQGWSQLVDELANCRGRVMQICRDSQTRLHRSEEQAIPVTVALLGFESPHSFASMRDES